MIINIYKRAHAYKYTLSGTLSDVAHGMSGGLGFRAGLWLSCFPGRVRDDMEL